MLSYLIQSFRRKIARRFTKAYPAAIQTYPMGNLGEIEFAHWTNPLARTYFPEPGHLEFFRQFIKEGDLVVDIGANYGDTTVPMALAAGGSGCCLGFDPNPLVSEILKVNAGLNPGKMNLIPVPYAISDAPASFYFVSSEASFANGGISSEAVSKHGKYLYPEKIQGVNLKSFLQEHYLERLPRLSFIKIDTEGYDKEILKSITDLLQSHQPAVVAESFGKASPAAKMELYSILDNIGYQIHYFEDFDIHAQVERLEKKEDMLRFEKTINIYAIMP